MGLYVTRSVKLRKSNKKPQTPLLPGDLALLRQLEEEKKSRRKDVPEKLKNLGKAVHPWQLTPTTDLQLVMKSILDRQWVELKENEIYHETYAAVLNFRAQLPPFVLVSQIYGVFPQSSTFIDRAINKQRKAGIVRLFTVNMGDCSDLLLDSDSYFAGMDLANKAFQKFQKILSAAPEATWLSVDTLHNGGLARGDIENLVHDGYLSIDPGNPQVRGITAPMQGAFLKLAMGGRSWLMKVLMANKWHELPENVLQEKLDSSKGYWKTLKGVSLEYILYEALGSGWIDGFKTPIGRGWKVLRTK